MALTRRAEYLASLRRLRPNVYKFGERIEDVTSHPATRRTVESHARAFDAAHDPERAPLFTTRSCLSGEAIHRHNALIHTMEDLLASARLKREMFHLTGTCTGGLCVGWNAMNALWAVAHEVDVETGSVYGRRLETWVREAQRNGWVVAGALTDAKGDRSLPPSAQPDSEAYLCCVASSEEGIVVRGAKLMICGVAASHEILVLPGSALSREEGGYAVAFAVPRDADGLTIVETRRASDTREQEEGADLPGETGITQSYLIFDDLFVPSSRVFLCGEHAYAGRLVELFTANYRSCIGACVAGQGDVMIGAAVLMARANGLPSRTFSEKLVQMAVHNETTFGLGAGAVASGALHPSGIWFADPLLANVNKVLVASLPQETRRLCQEIGGGIVETGCLPSSRDLDDARYGAQLLRYVRANPEIGARARARAARLCEWLTIGAGVPGCMHGGGSPQSARLVVRSKLALEEFAGHARALAGIEGEIPEPGRNRP